MLVVEAKNSVSIDGYLRQREPVVQPATEDLLEILWPVLFFGKGSEHQEKEVMIGVSLRGISKAKGRTLVCHRKETQGARPPRIAFYPMCL
jgi:hypothetical protein